MAKTVAYIQEHGYDTQKKLQDTTDTIQSKMAKARSDAKLTEAKLKRVNEQIHYLGQYLSTKSVYADFLKSTNKKDFRQNYADEIAKYEEALQFLKQHIHAVFLSLNPLLYSILTFLSLMLHLFPYG